MSISASMNAGVLGLAANATRLSAIADNLANASTVGYKRADVQFSSMVAAQSSARQYWAGGVLPTVRHAITDRGVIQTTSASTDFAVGGRGFLPVVNTTTPGAVDAQQDEFLLTAAGSFRTDGDGFLRNSAGLYALGWRLNPDGTTVVANPARDSFQSLEAINVTGINFTASPTTAIGFAANLPAQATEAGGTGQPFTMPIEYFDPLGNSERVTLQFTPTVPAAGSSNEWTLQVLDSASGGAAIGEFTITFNGTSPNAGTIAAVTPTLGAYDAATGMVTVTTAAGEAMQISIGTAGNNDGLTQLAGGFTPTQITKNGAAFATVADVELGEDGILSAVFTNGQRQPIYRIPLVDVVNPDGLTPVHGNAFRLSRDSGAMYLWDAGDGPVGKTLGFSLELSTTDVAKELTSLIETQRAYSSNAKVIQTADEMLQETTNLKR
jgi:flagellar hook protein FlgE